LASAAAGIASTVAGLSCAAGEAASVEAGLLGDGGLVVGRGRPLVDRRGLVLRDNRLASAAAGFASTVAGLSCAMTGFSSAGAGFLGSGEVVRGRRLSSLAAGERPQAAPARAEGCAAAAPVVCGRCCAKRARIARNKHNKARWRARRRRSKTDNA
jgi:hypothetical protein